jgi:hypothetical protein
MIRGISLVILLISTSGFNQAKYIVYFKEEPQDIVDNNLCELFSTAEIESLKKMNEAYFTIRIVYPSGQIIGVNYTELMKSYQKFKNNFLVSDSLIKKMQDLLVSNLLVTKIIRIPTDNSTAGEFQHEIVIKF